MPALSPYPNLDGPLIKMKYYKFEEFDFHPLGGTTYIESENGCSIRQITAHAGRFLASNVSHPDWGLVLADQCVDFDDIEEVTSISAFEFEDVWQSHLQQHQREWGEVKQAHPLGSHTNGIIRIFYPQGVIIDLNNNALGVADYNSCCAGSPPDWIPRTGYKVTSVVGGYDETNQWVILQNPQVRVEQK